ncbi:DJ-1/PfpI family protein [Corallincola platygyrae]|uniref:DJ-1/PfpI family protein n=1 Tax=Corallincola platygyrae TaxID=1193278 RepID=A0ABW4XLB8_9GAMM
MAKYRLLMLMFDGVEVLDFAGPFEVFSVTDEEQGGELLDVKLVSVDGMCVTARNGLSVNVDAAYSDYDEADILLLPGGNGTRALLSDEKLLAWIDGVSRTTVHTLTVCSGALVLAKTGLLAGLDATTHNDCFELLAELAPDANIKKSARFTDNGHIVTSGGISAGIDMSLYMVAKLFGEQAAEQTIKVMEYHSDAWRAE